jgi:3-isopropylmalate dehydratase small subunit
LTSEGRVWKFGDDINTDLIIPGRHLSSYDPAHLAKHVMEGVSKDFAASVRKGDIVIAGRNFGCGSSREQAVTALMHAGIAAVVARSFARIFYRNAINLGLPVLISDDAALLFDNGDVVSIDWRAGSLASVDGSKKAKLEEIPRQAMDILENGGLVPHIKAQTRHRQNR